MKLLPIFIAFISFAGLAAADTTVVVTPPNMDGWAFHTTNPVGALDSGGDASAGMVFGPGTPPLGAGSAHFNTGSNGFQTAQIRSVDFGGVAVSSLTALNYNTYATAWNGSQVPYLNLYLDTDNNGSRDDRLWFEPAYSNGVGGNPAVALNTWQHWDAFSGLWYDDNGTAGSGPGANAKPLATILAALPAGTVINNDSGVGGIRFASGGASAGNSFNAYVDAFTIGVNGENTTYNFEAVPEPSTYAAGAAAALSLGFGAFRRIRSRARKA